MWTSLGKAFESPTNDGHQAGRCGEIPIGVGHLGMANIGRKRAYGVIDVYALSIPLLNTARWSMDFVSDKLADGRSFRILTIVDQFTRECVEAVKKSLYRERSAIFWRKTTAHFSATQLQVLGRPSYPND